MLAKVALGLEFLVVFPQAVKDDFPKGKHTDFE